MWESLWGVNTYAQHRVLLWHKTKGISDYGVIEALIWNHSFSHLQETLYPDQGHGGGRAYQEIHSEWDANLLQGITHSLTHIHTIHPVEQFRVSSHLPACFWGGEKKTGECGLDKKMQNITHRMKPELRIHHWILELYLLCHYTLT